MLMTRVFPAFCFLLFTNYLMGCSRGPARVNPPHIDLESAAEEAIQLYDTDKDGSLNEAELAHCPGMLAERAAYDTDANGLITRDEITERIKSLRKYGVGLTRLQCEVRVNGRPLDGAAVRFDPEPYLGDEIKPAIGTTNQRGLAQMAIPAEELPRAQQGLKAIHYGTYKVRITHPKISLPPKYNTQTTLGYETRTGDPYASYSLTVP